MPPEFSERIFIRALKVVLLATRGGPMRARILVELCEHPTNPLALAKKIGIDYKTALHHLEKLRKQNLVIKKGDGYGAPYHVTFTPEQKTYFESMHAKLTESGK